MHLFKASVKVHFLIIGLVFFFIDVSVSTAGYFGNGSSDTGFGTVSNTDTWIDNSVQQKNGVLYISSSGSRIALDPAEFGGEDSFIWQTIKALTDKGQALAKEDIQRLATAIIEKYLLHIDSWPEIKNLLQSYGVTDEKELESMREKFENSVPKAGDNYDYNTIQKLFDLFSPFDNKAPGYGDKLDDPLLESVSLVSRFDEKTGKFVTEIGGELVGLAGSKIYTGSITGDRQITIVGDAVELTNLDKALALMQASSIKDRTYNNDPKSTDFYNCLNFAEDTQEMLQDNGIDAYLVTLSGRSASDSSYVGHAAVAIKVGEVEYSNGDVVPTFAVVETIGQPRVMGQVGGVETSSSAGTSFGAGTSLSQGYGYSAEQYTGGGMNITVDNAIVFNDAELTKGAAQYPVVQSGSEVYTYTAGNVYINNNDMIKIEKGRGGTMIDK